MRRLKLLLAVMSTMSIGMLSLAYAMPVHAEEFDPVQGVCDKINGQGEFCSSAGKADPLTGTDGVIIGAAKITAIIAGISAIIIIIIAGARLITSSGDANTIGKAKGTIVYALIGLVIAAIAPSIVAYVLKNVIK